MRSVPLLFREPCHQEPARYPRGPSRRFLAPEIGGEKRTQKARKRVKGLCDWDPCFLSLPPLSFFSLPWSFCPPLVFIPRPFLILTGAPPDPLLSALARRGAANADSSVACRSLTRPCSPSSGQLPPLLPADEVRSWRAWAHRPTRPRLADCGHALRRPPRSHAHPRLPPHRSRHPNPTEPGLISNWRGRCGGPYKRMTRGRHRV